MDGCTRLLNVVFAQSEFALSSKNFFLYGHFFSLHKAIEIVQNNIFLQNGQHVSRNVTVVPFAYTPLLKIYGIDRDRIIII